MAVLLGLGFFSLPKNQLWVLSRLTFYPLFIIVAIGDNKLKTIMLDPALKAIFLPGEAKKKRWLTKNVIYFLFLVAFTSFYFFSLQLNMQKSLSQIETGSYLSSLFRIEFCFQKKRRGRYRRRHRKGGTRASDTLKVRSTERTNQLGCELVTRSNVLRTIPHFPRLLPTNRAILSFFHPFFFLAFFL